VVVCAALVAHFLGCPVVAGAAPRSPCPPRGLIADMSQSEETQTDRSDMKRQACTDILTALLETPAAKYESCERTNIFFGMSTKANGSTGRVPVGTKDLKFHKETLIRIMTALKDHVRRVYDGSP